MGGPAGRARGPHTHSCPLQGWRRALPGAAAAAVRASGAGSPLGRSPGPGPTRPHAPAWSTTDGPAPAALPAGWLYDQTASWSLALFAPSIFFFLTGSGGRSFGALVLLRVGAEGALANASLAQEVAERVPRPARAGVTPQPTPLAAWPSSACPLRVPSLLCWQRHLPPNSDPPTHPPPTCSRLRAVGQRRPARV